MRSSRRACRSLLAGAGSLLILAGLLPGGVAPVLSATPVFINEIHYDNGGADTDEGVEIAGPAGTSLTGWSLVPYNGSNGTTYSEASLSGTIPDQENGFGTVAVDITGLQNGAPDGIALVNGATVVQFLSYEGTFTATNGPAVGELSVDIGVSQSGSEDPGLSLGLTGAGSSYEDFDWSTRLDDSFGSVNPGQLFGSDARALSVSDVTAQEGDAGTTAFAFTVSLSQPAAAGGTTFDIATAEGTATAGSDYVAMSLTGQTIPQGASTYTFTVTVSADTTVEPNETFFVNVSNVVGADLLDGQGIGTIVNDDVAVAHIHDIQTNDASSAPGSFTIEGIVVGDYQTQGGGQLRGFFLQEEDADVDADPASSEGIFVFCGGCPVAVTVGDKVRVTGSSSEYFNMTQLSATTASSVALLSSGNPLPTPATADLPVPGVPSGDIAAATAAINSYFETREGMLVRFPDTLSVAEYFELARYGQIILSEGSRPHTFTAVNEPSQDGLIDHEIDLLRRSVILDDEDNIQNRPIAGDTDTPYYHPSPGLSTTNFFRGGDTITDLTGVLHWSFAGQSGTDAWRIRPVTQAFSYDFSSANPRAGAPDVDGRLKVASFNVLNYFRTIDTTSSGSVGTCGASKTLDCRGADSEAELQRQRTKLVAALTQLDADVIGLMELENTPDVEPMAHIVAGLPGYGYVDTGVTGRDAIKVGIIYRTSTVAPVGGPAVLDTQAFVNPRNADVDRNRPAVAQTFREVATDARITVVVNHLKSKGSGCGAGDDDTTSGQGNCNLTRTLAAQELARWLATDPTNSGDRDVLIIGDLNAYAKEAPIDALRASGYTDLVAKFGGADAYSYVFDGQLGYLDHSLSSPTLTPQVVDVTEWHINADEVPLFDYNDEVRDPGESSFEEESNALPLYGPDEFRTSDHDPVIVGLDLANLDLDLSGGFLPPVEEPPAVNTARAGSSVPLRFSVGGDEGFGIFFTAPEVFPCGWGIPGQGDAAASSGPSGLRYDPVEDVYAFSWGTSATWSGDCKAIEFTFDDGSYLRAEFAFRR